MKNILYENESDNESNSFFDPDAPVEVFDSDTVAKLLKEKDSDGKKLYSKKDIIEAKNETERLMKIMDHLPKHEDEQEQVDENTGSIVANCIDFNRTYSLEEEREMKRGLSKFNQYLVQYTIELINLYHYDTDMKNVRVPHEIKSIKELIKCDKKSHNVFLLDPTLVEIALKAIKLHNGEMNASKKKKVQISTTMPHNKCIKYGFVIEQIFESQNDLIEYCKRLSGNTISKNSIRNWKKVGYLKEI